MDQGPRLGKRELIYLLLFTRNYVVSIGEVCSSSGCLGWATLFYCDTPCAFHMIIFGGPSVTRLSSIYSLHEYAFLLGKA